MGDWAAWVDLRSLRHSFFTEISATVGPSFDLAPRCRGGPGCDLRPCWQLPDLHGDAARGGAGATWSAARVAGATTCGSARCADGRSPQPRRTFSFSERDLLDFDLAPSLKNLSCCKKGVLVVHYLLATMLFCLSEVLGALHACSRRQMAVRI